MDTEKLRQEKEKFEALFQHASIGIVVANSVGEIILVNKFLLLQFGYEDTDELIGKKIEHLIPSRYHTAHVHYRDHFIEDPHARPMGLGRDLFAVKKGGTEFPVEISLSNYTTARGSFAIAFVSDITRRKESEIAIIRQKEQLSEINQQVKELNEQLEEKVELRTKQLQETMLELESSKDHLTKALSKEKDLSDLKSRFVSMASHEFRTPLSTILSSAALTAKYTEAGEQDKRDKHINRIKSSVTNLTSLLDEFLSIGKIEDGKIKAHCTDVNIKEFISTVYGEMEGIVKKGQKLSYIHSGEVLIFSDPVLLRNIITNLLSNAIKFSPEQSLIVIISEVKGDQVLLCIKDHGMGISPGDQQHLFERFFRGTNATNIQGTGLGLHIVVKYLELLGGKIEFESELEKGTTFRITLKKQG